MTLTPEAPTTWADTDRDDHRGSPIPTAAMITTRFMELRRRRGLMITLGVVTIGIPTVYLVIRLILHLAAPGTYGPAGGYETFGGLTSGVLYTFGFIAAATLGCTAGSIDLSEGVFRHLVITGRSRTALYLARIPAGLAIIAAMIAVGYAVVCVVCVSAAPKALDYDGVSIPVGLSRTQLETFAVDNAAKVLCNLPYDGPIGCNGKPGGDNEIVTAGSGGAPVPATQAQIRQAAVQVADGNYAHYARQFLTPPTALMIKTGLWIELEAAIGFLVGLGLGALTGQRTVSVILMFVLEVILTPIAVRTHIPHFINVQRGIVGVATDHFQPGQLPSAFGGGGGDFRVTDTTTTAVCVIVGWVVVWTGLGIWRMSTRDA